MESNKILKNLMRTLSIEQREMLLLYIKESNKEDMEKIEGVLK